MSASPAAGGRLLADRYLLGETLGRGGMADVYRATDRLLDREVAVKVLRQSTADESARARFIDEARTLAGLTHDGLVTLLDAGFGTDDGDTMVDQPFLVMELVEGPSLAERLTRGPVAADVVRSIGAQVADTLAHVHARGVIHRDVTPGNLLLGEHRVQLADFGIARLLGDTAGHTRTGETIGTAAYLAPEQVTGQPVSGATDVYSLGLVMLEALTGRREYPGPATEAALARLHRPPEIPEHLGASWRLLLADTTALEPTRRPSASVVADRLRHPDTAPFRTRGAEGIPVTEPVATAAEHPSTMPFTTGEGTQVLERPVASARSGRRPRGAVVAGVAAFTVVLVVILVVAALLDDGGDGADPEIPANTPAELREPLEDLHRAIEGEAG